MSQSDDLQKGSASPKRKRGSKLSNRQLARLSFLLLLLVVALGSFVAHLQNRRLEVREEELARVERPHESTGEADSPEQRASMATRPEEANLLPVALTLNEQQLSRNSAGRVVRVRVRARPGCIIGELDALQRELAADPQQQIVLSLEPLFAEASLIKPIVRPVSLRELRSADVVRVLVVEPRNEPLHLALYLCRDSKGDQSCFKKELADMTALHQRASLPPERRPAQPADQTYFFNYLLLRGDRLVSIDNQSAVPDYAKLEAFLKEDPAISASQAAEVTDRVKQVNESLRSYPVLQADGEVVIELPYLDEKHCATLGLSPELP